MQEQIEAGKSVRFGPKGTSMLPLIRQFEDTVVLEKAPLHLKKYDLPLYQRDSGQFVLHRVVGEDKDGYVMCGDNQSLYEHGITDSHILAVAVGMYRGEEYVSFTDKKYIAYTHKQVRQKARIRSRRKMRASIVAILKKLHIFPLCKKAYYYIYNKK